LIVKRCFAIVALALPLSLGAQQPAATPVTLNFSGILLANFQYRGDAGPSKAQNKFDIERVYLTFRMPAGDRGSIRVTTDLFQQTTGGSDAYYKGWVLRAKYAYFQYDYLKSTGWNAVARAGLIHTVAIDHIEGFWPRWISQTAIERAGFFSSADAGIGTVVTLPSKWGEAYATITNGPGYTSRETDRFKDYSARLSLTPLSSNENRFLKTLTLTGWTYRGAIASKFVAGGPGQIGAVGSGLDRNRSGIFAAIKDPRLVLAGEWATRTDGSETGANTTASPRAVVDSSGRLLSGFIVLHPLNFSDVKKQSPLGLVARWDRFKPNTNTAAFGNTIIGGATWDLNNRSSLSLDYQEQTPHFGPAVATSKTYFLHLVANF
jgi:hypothetical protein